jgi:hypothetical protein
MLTISCFDHLCQGLRQCRASGSLALGDCFLVLGVGNGCGEADRVDNDKLSKRATDGELRCCILRVGTHLLEAVCPAKAHLPQVGIKLLASAHHFTFAPAGSPIFSSSANTIRALDQLSIIAFGACVNIPFHYDFLDGPECGRYGYEPRA